MAGGIRTKLLYQDCDSFMQAGLKKRDRINEEQLKFINSSKDKGFLPIRWEKTSARNVLRYNVSNMTALSEYVKQNMSQDKYFGIICQFQRIYEFCSKTEGLSVDNLILSDLKNLYFDVDKQKLYVAYLPLNEHLYKCSNVVKFLSKLHKSARVSVTNGVVMQKYRFFLEDSMSKQTSKSPRNGGLSYDQLYSLLHDVLLLTVEEEQKSIVTQAPKEEHVSTDTVIVDRNSADDEEGDHTVLVNRKTEECLAFLKDENNREYPIEHVPFTIGRRQENDLPLTDKGTVSKLHAAITFEDGKWYIEDKGSANGTFLNNFVENSERVTKDELASGDVIYIYDVPFVFTVSGSDSATVPVNSDGSKKEPANKKVKRIAYFINSSSKEKIPVFVYPFTCAELSGVIIDRENNGSRHSISVENIACNSLSVEDEAVPAGSRTSLFSGCKILYHGITYTFYEEN